MIRLALIALLSGCAAHIGVVETRNSQTVERIYHDMGGQVIAEQWVWQDRRDRHGIASYVLDGGCSSFCAFEALAFPATCFTKNATLGVHPVSMFGIYETDATRALTASMVARWPRGLRDWWSANRPPLIGRDLVYADLVDIIPERECDELAPRGFPKPR